MRTGRAQMSSTYRHSKRPKKASWPGGLYCDRRASDVLAAVQCTHARMPKYASHPLACAPLHEFGLPPLISSSRGPDPATRWPNATRFHENASGPESQALGDHVRFAWNRAECSRRPPRSQARRACANATRPASAMRGVWPRRDRGCRPCSDLALT